MPQDVVVNGTTYPAVEAIAMTDANGNTVTYYPDAIRYVPQALTDEQKAKARDNIDALGSSELTPAINTALAQAKTSGEFDGATGQRGFGLLSVTTAPSSYTTAVGGITPKYRMALSTIKTQAGVTEVLLGDTIRYSYYQYSIAYLDASYAYFTTRVSLRGATGANGNTSVKVVTKAEYSALTAESVAQLYAEGIRLIIVEDGYTNLVPTSIDAAGNIYRGCGYRNGYRLTSSGDMTTSDNCCVSGFMPYTHGSTIRIVGSCGDALSNAGQYIGLYDENYNIIKIEYASSVKSAWEPRADGLWEMVVDTNKISSWSNAKFFRVSCAMCVGADMVVTVNEPIGLEV